MPAHASRFLELVHQAKARITEVTLQDVKPRIDAGEKLNVIDVREESEWAAGHVPGAVHLGKGIIERDIEKAFPDPDTELILYCGGGYRSALAADALRQMGYTRAISMDGGFRAWREAGGQVEAG